MNRPLLLLGLLCVAAGARAQDSQTFTASGEILPGVCKIAFPDVPLGSHPASLFTGSYGTPYIDFNGTVSDCDPLVLRVTMTFVGNADPDNAALFQGVPGVGIELVRAVGGLNVPIPPGGSTLFATATGIYPFRARFLQSAATVAAGRVTRPVTVSLTYN